MSARASWRAPAASKENVSALFTYDSIRRPCTMVIARRFILRVINADIPGQETPLIDRASSTQISHRVIYAVVESIESVIP